MHVRGALGLPRRASGALLQCLVHLSTKLSQEEETPYSMNMLCFSESINRHCSMDQCFLMFSFISNRTWGLEAAHIATWKMCKRRSEGEGCYSIPNQGSRAIIIQKTCWDSFSSVSKPIFASKYSLFSIFQTLQVLRMFTLFQTLLKNSFKNTKKM